MKNQLFYIVFFFCALKAKSDNHVPTGYVEETTLPSEYLSTTQEVSNYEVKADSTSDSELPSCVDQRPSCCPDCPDEICSLPICVVPSEEPIPKIQEGESYVLPESRIDFCRNLVLVWYPTNLGTHRLVSIVFELSL